MRGALTVALLNKIVECVPVTCVGEFVVVRRKLLQTLHCNGTEVSRKSCILSQYCRSSGNKAVNQRLSTHPCTLGSSKQATSQPPCSEPQIHEAQFPNSLRNLSQQTITKYQPPSNMEICASRWTPQSLHRTCYFLRFDVPMYHIRNQESCISKRVQHA